MSAALNPMVAAFGLGAGAGVAGPAAFAAFRQNQLANPTNTGLSSSKFSLIIYFFIFIFFYHLDLKCPVQLHLTCHRHLTIIQIVPNG